MTGAQRRAAARESRRRERSRPRFTDRRGGDPGYAQQGLAFDGGPTFQNGADGSSVRSEPHPGQKSTEEMSYLEKRHNESRGRYLLIAAADAAAAGRCDRALYLYSVAVVETQVDLEPMASGITPCFAVLAEDPAAHPELAAAFGITD